jgi:hypothetical protein
MVHVELNNMYINVGENKESEKLWWGGEHCDFR